MMWMVNMKQSLLFYMQPTPLRRFPLTWHVPNSLSYACAQSLPRYRSQSNACSRVDLLWLIYENKRMEREEQELTEDQRERVEEAARLRRGFRYLY
ncbi:hypothetical protein JVT61DRAFT_10277 [Boletus reticuloceps]|uniref:Uncharacterized protein n=1 Tax=Boletus reticuloceps TaxID=495285 RepID=A0A8I2YYZ4_9AGAM|nr:hypothetical protein JVT61DRAFT_10277 [Boletus reticuloceps]